MLRAHWNMWVGLRVYRVYVVVAIIHMIAWTSGHALGSEQAMIPVRTVDGEVVGFGLTSMTCLVL